jgi:hypothetical protein
VRQYTYPNALPKRQPGSRKARIQAALIEEIEDLRSTGDTPTTLRFLFYRLVARGIVGKGEKNGYHQTSDVLVALREAQVIEMGEIADRTSGAIDWTGYLGVDEWTRTAIAQFRLDRWGGASPLLMVESNSLAGVLEDLAREYRVVLVPFGGQASCGLLGAELPRYVEDDTRVLYLGDFDPAGEIIEQSARGRLEAYAGVTLDWARVALTEEQVEEYDLPVIEKGGHPTVETEALDQRVLVQLVREALDDLDPVDVTAEEKRRLAEVLARLEGLT